MVPASSWLCRTEHMGPPRGLPDQYREGSRSIMTSSLPVMKREKFAPIRVSTPAGVDQLLSKLDRRTRERRISGPGHIAHYCHWTVYLVQMWKQNVQLHPHGCFSYISFDGTTTTIIWDGKKLCTTGLWKSTILDRHYPHNILMIFKETYLLKSQSPSSHLKL